MLRSLSSTQLIASGAASPTQNLIPDAEEFVSFSLSLLAVPTQFFVVVSSILEKAGEENE